MHNSQYNLKDSVLEKIESSNIKPTPSWQFIVQHGFLWLPGTFITLLGAYAWAGILFGLDIYSFEYYQFISTGRIRFLLYTLPLIWVGSFLLFTGLIVQTVRLTPNGYKLDSKKIIGGSFLISLMVGTLLYYTDNRGFKNQIMRYPVEHQHRIIWSRPDIGHIAGYIYKQEDIYILTDFNKKQWALDTTFLPTTTKIEEGRTLRLVGKQIDRENFLVCVVLPWNFSSNSTISKTVNRPTMMLFSTSTDSRPCEKLIKMSQSYFHERKDL